MVVAKFLSKCSKYKLFTGIKLKASLPKSGYPSWEKQQRLGLYVIREEVFTCVTKKKKLIGDKYKNKPKQRIINIDYLAHKKALAAKKK